jgi:aminodeoxyfutalosine synthase
MLYGHIETYAHRVAHMNEIRNLQDRTNGFNAFIPLKFRKQNNFLSHLPEITLAEDLRNYAVARIFLDNISHLKAYWPMIGKEAARLALHFGADDLDGTIHDSTKIYSLAGSEEKSPNMPLDELTTLIKNEGFVPVERNSIYKPVISK